MKRVYSLLLLALFAVTGAWAQVSLSEAGIEVGKVYTVKASRGGWTTNSSQFISTGDAGTTASTTDVAQQFAFVPSATDESKVYLYSVGQKMFVKKDRSLVEGQGDRIYVFQTGDSSYPLFFSFTSDKSNYNVNIGGGKQMTVDTWKDYDAGNKVMLTEVTNDDFDLAAAQEMLTHKSTAIAIIPYPSSLTKGTGTLKLSAFAGYQDNVGVDSVSDLISQFVADLAAASGITLTAQAGTPGLSFVKNETLGREDYNLTIDTLQGITIEASSYAGFFYALGTIRQLLPREIYTGSLNTNAEWTLPALTIADTPEMPVRGFMLDVARHFFTVDEVKKLIDVASVYKLNRFHWHLTDDQGWRIQIPEYPLLTEVGAVRKSSLTLNAVSTNFFDDTEYGRGCYYTLEELADVVNYAKARNVEILPEVDLPGHMVAAIASYPWLSCDSTQAYDDSYHALGTPKEVRVNSGVSRDVLNVSDPRVISFLKTVLGHVATVFPYPYVHIGGDECPTAAWDATQSVKDWMGTIGLTSTDQIQPWLVEELGSWLRDEYGKGVTVWNELVVKGHWNDSYTVDPVVFSYSNNTQNGDSRNVVKQVTEKGFRTIATTTTPMYFDLLQASTSDMEFDAPYIGGYGDSWVNTVQSVYNYNPAATAGDSAHLVIGTQGTLWTESCCSADEMEYQMFPRLLSVSEVGWLPYSQRNYSNFYSRLQDHRSLLQAKDVRFAPYAFEDPELTASEEALVEADTLLTLCQPGAVGYPAQADYDALNAATEALRADANNADKLTALQEAIAAYKAAAIKMPEAGKYYEIINASTYYKQRYNGSSLYLNGSGYKIHYTPQLEPEEVYSFVPATAAGSYYVKALLNGKNLVLATTNNGAVTASATDSTALQIRSAQKANAKYDYRPGVVNLRGTSTVLAANNSGNVIASTDSTLSYPGSWYIREITDFTAHLQALVAKAKKEIATATPGAVNEPSQEALDFLQSNIVTPGQSDVAAGNVSKQTYDAYVALYNEYLAMPRTSALDALDEGKYYKIQNAYWKTKYAVGNASTNAVDIKDDGTTEGYDWVIAKNADGTVRLTNRATGTSAYVSSSATDTKVSLGQDYDWTVFAYDNSGDNVSGLAICESSGANSWYSNPNAWSYVLLKPYTWGAALWNFVENGDIPTGITPVVRTNGRNVYYDLQGRRVKAGQKGIYVNGNRQKVLH